MGAQISKWFTKKPVNKILLIGQYGSGRTTALNHFRSEQDRIQNSSLGINLATLQFQTSVLQIWDVTGSQKLRETFWFNSYESTKGIAFLIDLQQSDREYMQQSKQIFKRVIDNTESLHIPILIIANKIDIAAITVNEALEFYELKQLQRKIKVITACALTGEGLKEGFQWLHHQISQTI